jgi:uncharacterized phiE125 gp8 family phage protein
MTLILTTPPLAEPITLAEAKAHLRITHNDDDAYVQRLVTAARRQIEARLGLSLITQGWSLFLDRWPEQGAARVALHPVQQVTDIITYGEQDTPATLDPAHYFLDNKSRPARIVLRSGRPFPVPGRTINGIEIKFVAGFGAAAATVPDEIRQALLLTVAAWYADRGETESGFLPLMARELIAPFKHVRLS